MTADALARREVSRPGDRTTAAAGVSYLLAWVIGLAVFSSSTTVTSTGSALLAQYQGHAARLTVQFALTEGLAGVALAVVVLALARGVGRTGLGRAVEIAGCAAAAVSLVQCALGSWLASELVPDRRVGTIGSVSTVLDRLDGLKMLLLAVALLSLAVAVRRGGTALPRWTAHLTGVTAVSLLASALGYGLLYDALSLAAWISLPLLIASITGCAVVLSRRGRVPAGDTSGRSRASSAVG